MITTLTTEQAIELVPAIGATAPSDIVSDKYQFVSTQDILNRVQQQGWRITNATGQGSRATSQHRVTLVHETYLNENLLNQQEGLPRIEMFNSHDRTKRLMFAIGYFRFVCSNGLIIASGPAESIRAKHRFSDNKLENIMDQVSCISERFPEINKKITSFKERTLTEDEQQSFAEYAIRGRFLYRPSMPKRYEKMQEATNALLTSRRTEDEGNSAWQVYNRVQENLIRGIEGFSRGIRGYGDSVRVNQLLWKGTEVTLENTGNRLSQVYKELLNKDGQKGKISN